MNNMLDIVFILSVLSFNALLFLSLSTKVDQRMKQSKGQLFRALSIVGVILIIVILSNTRYLFPANASFAALFLLGLRFIAYKYSPLSESTPKHRKITQVFLDSVVLPFMVLVISVWQCLIIFFWDNQLIQ